jgi:aminoglycoside 3-N-acetyltransferase
MVHGSLRAIGPIIGGVNELVRALLDVAGPSGTLCAYLDFEPFYEEEDTWSGDPAVPVFDKLTAHAARDHGILHETLRTWPGALRSDHPDAGVMALGPLAEEIVSPHPLQYGYGDNTPFARIAERGGYVLMLGAPLDTVTMIHYADHLARIPDKRMVRYRRLMPGVDGPEWIWFEEFETSEPVHAALPENYIERIVEAFLAEGNGWQTPLGNAKATLLPMKELIPFAVAWVEREIGKPA